MSSIHVPIPALRESLRKNHVKKEEEEDDENEEVTPSQNDPSDLEPKDQHRKGGTALITSKTSTNVPTGNHEDSVRPEEGEGERSCASSEEANGNDPHTNIERVQENEVKINEEDSSNETTKTTGIDDYSKKRVEENDDEENNHNHVREGQKVSRDSTERYTHSDPRDRLGQEKNLEEDEDTNSKENRIEVQETCSVQTVINDEKNEIYVPVSAKEPDMTFNSLTIDGLSQRKDGGAQVSIGSSKNNPEKLQKESGKQIKPVLPDKPKKPGVFYPTDLNPFGDEDEEENSEETNKKRIIYPGDLNPFGDEEEETQETSAINKQSKKKDYDKSMNPFGEEEDDIDVTQVNPIPKPRRKNRPSAERPASEMVYNRPLKSTRPAPPIPGSKPVVTRPSAPPPRPPQSDYVRNSLNGSIKTPFDEEASPTPASRSRPPLSPRPGTPRKPPAPKPPSSNHQSPVPVRNVSSLSDRASTPIVAMSNETSSASKLESAPGTPGSSRSGSFGVRRPSVSSSVGSSSLRSEHSSFVSCTSDPEDKNRTLTPSDAEKKQSPSKPVKRQAPAPPSATRRTVIGSIETIQAELNNIGDRLAEIQIQMKHLEESFGNNPEYGDQLVYNYLELLKETCSLARKQEELMYQKREHRLEQEHADIEFEIRDIEIKPPFKRTPEDEERSAQLLQRLIEVIDERNDVVENMTRINKRPDFDRGLDKLRKLTSAQAVENVLPKFMEENDISVIETKIIPCNNIFHVKAPPKETEEERKARKKAEKETKKQERKNKKDAKKTAKREAKEQEEMEKFTQRLSIDGGRDSKLSNPDSNSVGGDSLKKSDKKGKSPLKAIKKFGATLSRSASTKRQSKVDGQSVSSPIKDGQKIVISAPIRPPLPDFKNDSVEDKSSESLHTTEDDSQKNSESHLI